MLPLDAGFLRLLAPGQTGHRAARQHEIIEGMGVPFAATLDSYAINTPLRIAHFLAQVLEESDGLCTTEEYASGQAYEGRKDLGNTHDGDGPRYKGRGLIQLTGRANYDAVGKQLKLDLVKAPLSVNDPYAYLLVSCVFWQQKKINAYCDANDVISVTQLVNGGQHGIESRKAYLAKAKSALAQLTSQSAAPPGGGLTVLHRGSSGDLVALLQQRLGSAGYPVTIDGDFGPATELAVIHFQDASSLPSDGVADGATWQALDALAASAGPSTSTAH